VRLSVLLNLTVRICANLTVAQSHSLPLDNVYSSRDFLSFPSDNNNTLVHDSRVAAT
jgi:hypothetical protein